MESTRLERMHASYKEDAQLDEVFVILTIGASMIATLGLQANSAAVVIGAMVVAPWILPLRASAFAVLIGDIRLLRDGLLTLLAGVIITIVLSALLGEIANLPRLGSEVLDRTSPTLLDLGIALVAGGIAIYAKLRRDAVSSLAGTAIAVALVPPVCVMGLLLSYQNWADAYGAGLLFATNLLGILSGALLMMAWKEPFFREQLRESHLSAANFMLTFGLTALLLIPLTSQFVSLVGKTSREHTRDQIQRTIETYLKRETLTFGGEGVNLATLEIAWEQNPPEIRLLVLVTNPALPSLKQVSAVQQEVNKRQKLDFQLIVQRVVVVEGPPEQPILITEEEGQLIKSPTRGLTKNTIADPAQQFQTEELGRNQEQKDLQKKLIRQINQ
ncbi:MAG TPA: DUF389 domain-containing protein [Prochlorococcus sp.]